MKVFDYEDVQLIPNKCIVNSRSECDTTVTLGKHSFKMPVVPANMQTIIDETIAETLAENGYFSTDSAVSAFVSAFTRSLLQ